MSEGDESGATRAEVTLLLRRLEAGDSRAGGELFELLYPELRKSAEAHMRGQPASQSLQPTALVNEAFLRLNRGGELSFADRGHFLLTAARAMRHVLIDHARAKGTVKRQGERSNVSIDHLLAESDEGSFDIEALERALVELEARDADMAKAVELRFFAGLSGQAAADVIGMPPRSLERRWQATKVWLRTKLDSAE